MLALLHSRIVFCAVVAAAAVVSAICLLCCLPPKLTGESAEAWLLIGWLGGAALLLAACLYRSRKKGEPLLPRAGALWGVLLIAGVGDLLCNISARYVPLMLPVNILLGMASICLLWALLRRFSLIFWYPFFVFQLAQHAGYTQYGARINALVIAETLESSAEEAMGYLTGSNLFICVGILILSGVFCWAIVKVLRRERQRLPMLQASLIFTLGAGLYATLPHPAVEKTDYYWPVSEAHHLYHVWAEAFFHNQATIHQAESLPSPALKGSALDTLTGDEGVVLVVHIGESVRADRMSINGYERDTTPWLRAQPRLINYPHCISAACDTCQAQLAILTNARRDIYETDPQYQPTTGSVLDLFAANHFKVYSFFGNRNATHLKYDLVVRLLTRCSEERFHAPGSPWTAVPQVADVLRREGDHQNTLIFINNEGSHTPFLHYDQLNPPFAPAGIHFDNPATHAQEVNNAYDATVHYTDEFVHRLINLLQGRPWVYLYISDHGEYLGHDGIWGRGGLGERQRDYHSTSGCRVGMFLLTSPEFEQLHPHFAQALQQLRHNSSLTVGHEHIFHTLLGLFGLRTPYYNPALDLASPAAQPYTGPCPSTPAGTTP